jgi:vancomycin resistance protein YoaR
MKKNKLLLLFAVLGCALFLSGSASAAAGDFELTYQDQIFSVSQDELQSWQGQFTLPQTAKGLSQNFDARSLAERHFGKNPKRGESVQRFTYDPKKVYELAADAALKLDAPAIEPVLKLADEQIVEFKPPQAGLRVNTFDTTLQALAALSEKRPQSPLLVDVTEPGKKLSETNNLGIEELLARGESNFKGSPNNRRHNIRIGTEKFQGILIKPGEEFSFNQHLGPVEEEQGFLPELVIKRTGTVPELGGGLCQVSSTAFRAAMQAGLPIVQRKNHAYAVKYYAPQGTDATIYPGVVDLKFKNDTPGHILVWAYLKDKDNLIFDFYGTKDDRKVTLEKPLQFDRKPDGSMKASWTREINKNGTTTSETFKSVYQSPDLFKVVESFIPAATSTPVTAPVSATN